MPLEVRSRAHLRDLLRDAGLSRTAAERVASGGFPALNVEEAAEDAVTRILAATSLVTGKPVAPAMSALTQAEAILNRAEREDRDLTPKELDKIRSLHAQP